MVCYQIPHGYLFRFATRVLVLWLVIVPVVILPFHIGIILFDEPHQFRWVHGGHGLVRIKFDAGHFCKVIDALRIFTTRKG